MCVHSIVNYRVNFSHTFCDGKTMRTYHKFDSIKIRDLRVFPKGLNDLTN